MSELDSPLDFPVIWQHPEESQRTWSWDSEHFAYPLTPLSIDLAEIFFQKTAVASGSDPNERRRVYPHGFGYSLLSPPADPSASPDQGQIERNERSAQKALKIRQLWRDEYLPPIRDVCRKIQRLDYASMTLTELASRLEGIAENTGRGFALTMVPAGPQFQCNQPFLEFCEKEFGADGRSMSTVMIQGYATAASAADTDLWKLARRASSEPSLNRALRGHNSDELVDVLPEVEGGALYMEALRQHLDRHGWRPDVWFELSLPTGRDDPRPTLKQIQRYIEGEDADPRNAIARSARRRRQMVRQVRSRLKNQPEKLDKFDSLLATASQFTPVSEGRAYWQLTLTGSLRAPCLALGEKMRKSGLLAEAADVVYLSLDEIKLVVDGKEPSDWPQKVKERREDRQRWMGVVPPAFIGAPIDRSAPEDSGRTLKFGAGLETQPEGQLLRGSGASVGIVRARARVVRNLEEADKVQQGDILVCRTTSPAWTPLFSRASAVVADSGGILSHCAIVAREFAIPCVVGVREGSARIRDGMIITVDGGQGTVRLED
jgi:rifampicin phosphotransferase